MKFTSSFLLPTEDFKDSKYIELEVNINIEPKTFVGMVEPEYSFKIPDYVFDEVADTEPQFTTRYNVNVRSYSGLYSAKTIHRKFQKRQTATSLHLLHEYMRELTKFIISKHTLDDEILHKKIFIHFDHNDMDRSNGLNGAYWGKIINSSFRFFTGYEVEYPSDNEKNKDSIFFKSLNKKPKYISKIRYASEFSTLSKLDTNFQESDDMVLPLPAHNQSDESFEKQFSIIDWTQEREDFCMKIQQSFLDLNSKLEEFLGDLNNDKFDILMEGNSIKLLS